MASLAASSHGQVPPPPPQLHMWDISATPGAEVAIEIHIIGVELADSVFSYELELSFDPSILALDSLSRVGTTTPAGALIVNNYDSTGGSIRIVSGMSTPMLGYGALLYLYCQVLTTATPGTSTSLRFDRVMLNEGYPPEDHFDGNLSVLVPAGFEVAPASLNFGIVPRGLTDSSSFEIVNPTPQSLVVIDSLTVAYSAITFGPIDLPASLENPGDSSRLVTVLCNPVSEDLISEQIGVYASTGGSVLVDVTANSDYNLFWETLAKTVSLQSIQPEVVDGKGNINGQADIGDLLIILKGRQPVQSFKTTPTDVSHVGTGGVR